MKLFCICGLSLIQSLFFLPKTANRFSPSDAWLAGTVKLDVQILIEATVLFGKGLFAGAVIQLINFKQ